MTKETQEITLYKEADVTALTLYRNNGLDPFIENIRKVANEFEADVTTEKGRKAFKSLAYKISQAKTKVDEIRKSENEEHQAAIKANNEKGKKAVEDLQAIQDDVKKPVVEWENRIKEHQEAISKIEEIATSTSNQWESMTIEQMQASIDKINSNQREWHEFSFKAENVKKQSIQLIEAAIAKRKKHDADKLELERLQKEEAERKQKERDAAIARKAAEDAKIAAEAEAERIRKEAEEKARIEKEEAEAKALAEKKAAEQRELELKQQKERAENEKKEAEEKLKRAELARIEAEKQAETRRIEAEKQAEIAKQEAVKEAARIESLRIEAEQKAKADEIAKRKADEEHKKKIILEAENALVYVEGFSQRLASSVITAIIDGKVPHVTFNY
jgi:hypothetical protein